DSGFHRENWLKQFPTDDYLRPDEAVKAAGVKPEDVTDIVISHAHWDHMGGIDLFPKATVWIQKQEFAYYTGDAWQPGGKHGGIDKEDVKVLVQLNTEGRLRLGGAPTRPPPPPPPPPPPAPATPSPRSTSAWTATRLSFLPRTTVTSTATSPSTRPAPPSARPTSPPTSATRRA